MNEIFNRTQLLLGQEAMNLISSAKVIVFGIGGVGSWCVEALVRSGISDITIVDADCISITNINRQLPALNSTIGQPKVDVLRNHILDINPDVKVTTIKNIYTEHTANEFNLSDYDYIIDAIDSLNDKALLILNATASDRKFYSSMGAALKMDISRIAVAEFWNVKGCPLAAALRRRFKRNKTFPKRKFKCVYSDELLSNKGIALNDDSMMYGKVQTNGAMIHITATFGLYLASLIIQDIIKTKPS